MATPCHTLGEHVLNRPVISRPLDLIWLALTVLLVLVVILRMAHLGLHIDQTTGAGSC